jgi:hypothetical protein
MASLFLFYEGEEPLHVISVIDASNQLIIASKNIYSRLEPNDPTKLFKKRHDCPSIGVQLA